jgi:hypothetical protein
MEYRWVNDIEGRIATFQSMGWEMVDKKEVGADHYRNSDSGNHYSCVGGTESGREYRVYLMKIPKECYIAIQRRENYQAELRDRTIRRGQLGNKIPGDKQYDPKEGRSITEVTR